VQAKRGGSPRKCRALQVNAEQKVEFKSPPQRRNPETQKSLGVSSLPPPLLALLQTGSPTVTNLPVPAAAMGLEAQK